MSTISMKSLLVTEALRRPRRWRLR